ncbi:MAG TPA: TetR/AcrR family transcriptional regulator [Gemmatirosa sp.]|nr:TetR/AcrR family transcriptional regulator [Gemmatirosa sp.]
MDTRLGRDDWMRAGRMALLTGGPAAVRVERLATDLGVTKGSFYWHFADRGELLEALLREWEEELSVALEALPSLTGPDGVRELMSFVAPRVVASERGELPSDAAIFAWASTDPAVARRVETAEARRIALLQTLVGDPELGEFLYLAYLGFVMRRRRVPRSAAFFPVLARISERVTAQAAAEATRAAAVAPPTSRRRPSPSKRGVR